MEEKHPDCHRVKCPLEPVDLNISCLNTNMAGYVTAAVYWSYKDGERAGWD